MGKVSLGSALLAVGGIFTIVVTDEGGEAQEERREEKNLSLNTKLKGNEINTVYPPPSMAKSAYGAVGINGCKRKI